MPQAPAPRAAGESDVAKLVTLHHRRRGWAWVAAGSAIGLAVYAGIDVNLLYILVVVMRDAPSRRSQRMPVPAGASPGVVRRTPHPDRGHHGSGARRRARRGRGRH